MIRKNKKGFTLVELLAVIVILALLIVITANTILPMMGKTKKTGMVTFAERVLRNAETALQADSIIDSSKSVFFYKISEITNQTDYVGCVLVDTTQDYYGIKIFSTTEKHWLYAATGDQYDYSTTINYFGTINSNGTISNVDLDKMEYEGTQMTLATAQSTSGTVFYRVEERCGGSPTLSTNKLYFKRFRNITS